MFNKEQISTLNQELDNNRIKRRDKGNISLSYLEGFDVINTANRVFGYGNWSYSITSLEAVSNEVNHNQNNVVCYKAILQIEVLDVSHKLNIKREDVGFGSGTAKTLADAHEGGAKEAVTDALKRALRSFGNQFGNSLYSKDKNKSNNQQNNNNTQKYNQPPNHQTQQNNSHNPPNYSNTSNNTSHTYQHQQDFSQLVNLGLSVVQNGDSLIVTGENIFENKDAIKTHGFRWDGNAKTWYMSLRSAA